ncbi:MAG TPA: S1/P1 nuclease [Pyrinomonadaceae bacterium]|jgi:hypothetical protein
MLKLKNLPPVLCALLLLQTTALAWGDNGHMVVAQIALNNLNPEKKEAAEELAALVEFGDDGYEFVTLACWMDDIRDAPMFEPLKDWHFITKRLIVGGAVPDAPPPPVNAVSVIEFLTERLANKREAKLKKAFYLAELIHLTGDLHQPLHAATRFTPDNPDGDRGGNLFLLSEDAPRPNLHSFWDSAGGSFGARNVARPLTTNGRKRIEGFAAAIEQAHPRSSLTAALNETRPAQWAAESFGLAKGVAYVGVAEGGIPNAAYTEKTKKTSDLRIALAGYRLADILNRVL